MIGFTTSKDITHDNIFDYLNEIGIHRAVVRYSGGNDEGGVDYITFYKVIDNELISVSEHREPWENYWDMETQSMKQHKLERLDLHLKAMCEPVYAKYYSFATEGHVHGEVVWDAQKRTAYFDGREEVTTWEAVDERIS